MNKIKNIIGRVLNLVVLPKEKITYIVSHILDYKKNVSVDTAVKDTVLIGALRNPSQLSICIRNKFYHIPKHLVVDGLDKIGYVAIYQSKNFFKRMSGIMYYGKVKKITELPRYKIKEIPKNTREMYLRFDIEKWDKLEEMIPASDVGIICEYTTIDRLKTAKDTGELINRNTGDMKR